MSEAIKLLKELLENSTPFYSAIEMDRGFDGEEWAAKAKALVDAHGSHGEGYQPKGEQTQDPPNRR